MRKFSKLKIFVSFVTSHENLSNSIIKSPYLCRDAQEVFIKPCPAHFP